MTDRDRLGPRDYIEYRFLEDLPHQSLHWLWPRRIPAGTLTLIVGEPGLGKSLLVADLAARISAGLPWPDEDAFPPNPPATCTAPPSPDDPQACFLFAPKPGEGGPPAAPVAPAPCGRRESRQADAPAELLRQGEVRQADAPAEPPRRRSRRRNDKRNSKRKRTAPASATSDFILHTSDFAPPAPVSCLLSTVSSLPALPAPREFPALPAPPRLCVFPNSGDLFNCPHRRPPACGEYLATPPRRTPPLAHMGVVYVCPEDPAPDVLRPRLVAAGGDLSRITVAETVTRRPSWLKLSPYDEYVRRNLCATDEEDPPLPFVLPDHADHLGQAVRAFDATGLVILDPLNRALSPAAQSDPPSMEKALAALTTMARQYNLAVIAVAHLAKRGSHRPLYRIRGSVSLIAIARAAYEVIADPDDRDRRIVRPLKAIHGPMPPSLSFRILPGPRLEWETPAQACGAADAAQQRPPIGNLSLGTCHSLPDLSDLSPDARSALSEACDWLADYLAAGPKAANVLLRHARAAGLTLITVRRAKRLLGIRSAKLENSPRWHWTLPGPP